MEKQTYFIGLDIGTNSVGWSVTDENLDLVKKKNKNLWGTRKFDAGDTAEQRRLYRSTRRRKQREKERIKLLRMLFEKKLQKLILYFSKKWKNPG